MSMGKIRYLSPEVAELLNKAGEGEATCFVFDLAEVSVKNAFGVYGDDTETFISDDGEEVWAFRGVEE